MNKNTEKNFDTGLRILEILKIFLNKDVSKNELINLLKDKSNIENVFSNEAFIKYFNTLKLLGLNIEKDKKSYKLTNALFITEITLAEEHALVKILNSSNKIYNKQLVENLINIFKKIDKYLNVSLSDIIEKYLYENSKVNSNNMKANLVNTLSNLINDNQKVYLTYKKNENEDITIKGELKNITERNNKLYITIFIDEAGRNKNILLDSIVNIKQSPSKNRSLKTINPVIFQVYGRLALSYRLKSSEKVIDFSNNHLTISNFEEDKERLMLRLLKYGENCKIIKPIELQKEFLELTNNILKNLEVL